MKTLTRQQLQARKEKAVRFTRDVRDDPDRAAEIEDESLDQYAEERRIKLTNPTRRVRNMPGPTRRELVERIKELEDDNSDLHDRLDEIADLSGSGDEDEDGNGNGNGAGED